MTGFTRVVVLALAVVVVRVGPAQADQPDDDAVNASVTPGGRAAGGTADGDVSVVPEGASPAADGGAPSAGDAAAEAAARAAAEAEAAREAAVRARAVADAEAGRVLSTMYPPPVEGPALRLPESPTRLYVDAAFAQTRDLSALPYIAGSATNLRFAAGGTLRWHRFSFDAEVPFSQVTTLNVTAVPGGMPIPQDKHETAVSFGDVRLGASWTLPLVGEALVGGFGLRTRLATHTTRFQFHLVDGTLATYFFPYYFHIEPTVIVGGALGRFTYVINEGALVLMGPNGEFDGMNIIVPTIAFWDSHVAVGYAPFDVVGVSVELGSDIQVNGISNPQFMINGVRSVWVAPALQLHFGLVRVDLIARIGLNRSADFFGVLDYSGTSSYTVRAGWAFN